MKFENLNLSRYEQVIDQVVVNKNFKQEHVVVLFMANTLIFIFFFTAVLLFSMGFHHTGS